MVQFPWIIVPPTRRREKNETTGNFGGKGQICVGRTYPEGSLGRWILNLGKERHTRIVRYLHFPLNSGKRIKGEGIRTKGS